MICPLFSNTPGPRSKEEIMYGKLQSFYNQQLVERLFLKAEAPYLSL